MQSLVPTSNMDYQGFGHDHELKLNMLVTDQSSHSYNIELTEDYRPNHPNLCELNVPGVMDVSTISQINDKHSDLDSIAVEVN